MERGTEVTEDGGSRQTAGLSDVCLRVQLLILNSESEKLFDENIYSLVSSGKMFARLFPNVLILSFQERKHFNPKTAKYAFRSCDENIQNQNLLLWKMEAANTVKEKH